MQNAGEVSGQTGSGAPQTEPGHRFENVMLITNESMNTGHRGVLIARSDSLEFQSKKGTLLMPKVRSVEYTGGAMSGVRLTVAYGGDGVPVQSASFMDQSQGKFRRGAVKNATQALADKLQSILNITEMSGQDRAVLDQTKRKKGVTQMVIGGLLAVAGTIITIVTYSNASSDSGGGTYIVAWGPIVFGLILFGQGFFQSRSR